MNHTRLMPIAMFVAFTLLQTGCGTSPARPLDRPSDLPVSARHDSPTDHARQRLTWAIERGPVGSIVRSLGASSQEGIVLMNGLENIPAGPYAVENQAFSKVVAQLGRDIGCDIEESSGYIFLYPTDYHILTEVALPTALDDAYAEIQVSAAFGSDTPMYSALALIGRELKLTLVADNAIAESRLGEISLTEIPLAQAIEALLKSARIQPSAFAISSSEEFIFFHSQNNGPTSHLLLSSGTLTGRERKILDERISLSLPARSGTELTSSAEPLGAVLDALSQQLGVRVRAEAGLETFPVNPVVMTNVRRRTAMDLLVGQWLRAEYGYEVNATGFVILRAKNSSSP